MFGSDRMLLESVAGLRAAGSHVVVALPSNGPLVDELRATGAEVVIVPMLVLRKALFKPSGWTQLFTTALRGLRSAWRLIGSTRPQVVYVSTTTLPAWPLIARMRGARCVSHVHEAEASSNRLVNRLLYVPHLASDLVLANSQFCLETIRASTPAVARRTTVVYNGIASPHAPAAPRRDSPGAVKILYVGRLSPRKGPDLVIKAAQTLYESGIDTRVTLVGAVFSGYEWFEEELRSLADRSGVPVEFAGFHTDVWPFLADCDVLMVPSVSDESFGNTAVEGVLGMRPVIVSDVAGLVEATAPYSTVRVVSIADVQALASAVRDLVASPGSTPSGLAASRRDALTRHSPAVYRSAIASAVLTYAGEAPRP